MSEQNEHYFEALDNDSDREFDEFSQDNETRQQRINRMMKGSLNDEGKDSNG